MGCLKETTPYLHHRTPTWRAVTSGPFYLVSITVLREVRRKNRADSSSVHEDLSNAFVCHDETDAPVGRSRLFIRMYFSSSNVQVTHC